MAVKGEKRDDAPTWLRVTVWGKQAETCNQYLTKGQEVMIQGSLRISKGQDGKEYTEVVANKVEFGAKPQVPANPETTFPMPVATQVDNEPAMQIGFSAVDDDIPF